MIKYWQKHFLGRLNRARDYNIENFKTRQSYRPKLNETEIIWTKMLAPFLPDSMTLENTLPFVNFSCLFFLTKD